MTTQAAATGLSGGKSDSPSLPAKVAILISGRGSNMMSLVTAATESDSFPARIAAVISNRPDAPGLGWARNRGLHTVALDHKTYGSRAEFDAELDRAIRESGAELVALAGFMRLMTPWLVERWRNRMLNIHPSLLPLFPGLDTHQRALDAGVRIAGCTVHLVRDEMDTGPILGQAAVPVLDGDTADSLAARVLAAEHELYPHVLSLFAAGAFEIVGEQARLRTQVAGAQALFSPTLT